ERSALVLHHRADDGGEDGAAADTAQRIAEQPAKRTAGRHVSATAHQSTKNLAARNAADRAAEEFRQLAHRRLLEGCADRLPADDAGDHLCNDWKKSFHFRSLLERRVLHSRIEERACFQAMSKQAGPSPVENGGQPVKERFLQGKSYSAACACF